MIPEEIIDKMCDEMPWVFVRKAQIMPYLEEAFEIYGKQQWNEAIKLAAEEVQLGHKLELWDDPKEGGDAWAKVIIIDKESILKLLK